MRKIPLLDSLIIQESLLGFLFDVVQSLSLSNSLSPHGLQHARLSCSSLSPRVCLNSCPLSWWCYLTISSSTVPFSSCLQSFPASGSIQMSQFFTSGSQIIGVSASASVLSMNVQSWFPLGLTDLISLQSQGLSRVFSSTTIQKQSTRRLLISVFDYWKIHSLNYTLSANWYLCFLICCLGLS